MELKKNKRLQVVFDFDGIMSGGTFWSKQGKAFKHLQYGIRYAINMLNWFDCDCYVLTADSTTEGQALTKKMLDNVNVRKVIFCDSTQKLLTLQQIFCNLDDVCYVADDLYDMLIAPQCGCFITNKNALPQLQKYADYVSSQTCDQYFTLDVANWIVNNLLKAESEWYVQKQTLNCMALPKLLTTLNTDTVLIVGVEDLSKLTDEELYNVLATKWDNSIFTNYYTFEQLWQSFKVTYKQANKLILSDLDWHKFGFIMPEAITADFARFLHLTKFAIDLTDAPIDSLQLYLENFQRAHDMLSNDEWSNKQQYNYINLIASSQLDTLMKLESIKSNTIAWLKSTTVQTDTYTCA